MEKMTVTKMEKKNDTGNDGIIDGDNDGKQKDNEAVALSPCGAAFAR